jgi:hypothetical protein
MQWSEYTQKLVYFSPAVTTLGKWGAVWPSLLGWTHNLGMAYIKGRDWAFDEVAAKLLNYVFSLRWVNMAKDTKWQTAQTGQVDYHSELE